MWYEAISKRITIDKKGNDKEISEKYLVNHCELCAEVEQKILEEWNGENRCTSVKESNIREFVNNRRNDEDFIFISTIEDIFIDENSGEEKTTKYHVGLFAKTIEEATKIMVEYMNQGLNDMRLTSVKQTKIIDVL